MSEPVPLPTHELVLLRCPSYPNVILASICTERAAQWIEDCSPFLSAQARYSVQASRVDGLPREYALAVSLCYNTEDVLRYMADKPWAAIARPGQSDSEAACATDPSADRTEPSP